MEIELDFTKCPFCGLALSTEAELTRKDELLRRAGKLISELIKLSYSYCNHGTSIKPEPTIVTCGGCRVWAKSSTSMTFAMPDKILHHFDCSVLKAQAFITIPEVVKVVEGK